MTARVLGDIGSQWDDPPAWASRRKGTGRRQAADDGSRLDALPRVVSPIDHAVRLTLGGVQNKLLLARLGDRWHLPIDGATSTHILKPEPERYPGLAVAEAWSLAVVSAVTKTAKAPDCGKYRSDISSAIPRADRRRPFS